MPLTIYTAAVEGDAMNCSAWCEAYNNGASCISFVDCFNANDCQKACPRCMRNNKRAMRLLSHQRWMRSNDKCVNGCATEKVRRHIDEIARDYGESQEGAVLVDMTGKTLYQQRFLK